MWWATKDKRGQKKRIKKGNQNPNLGRARGTGEEIRKEFGIEEAIVGNTDIEGDSRGCHCGFR